MKGIEKVFISIGLLVVILISGAIYVNNKVDKLLENPDRLGVLLSAADLQGTPQMPEEKADSSNPSDKNNTSGDSPSITPGEKQPSASDMVFDESIEAMIQTKLNKPIDRKDKIKVALILIKRLSVDDITYFYDLITLGNYTNEDIRKARNILTTKLSEDEIQTVRKMTEKYGFKP